MLQAVWQSLLQSTLNTKDMTIHTDISEIIGQCRHDLTLERSFYPRRYSINFYTRRLLPAVQPLTLLYTIFHEKRYPFRVGVPRSCPRIGHYREYPPGLLDDQSLVYTGSHKSSISLSFSFHCLCWKNDPQSEKKRKENHHRNNLFEILKLKNSTGEVDNTIKR